MAEYLARRGPAGARMMRQTAAFQVALDLDDEPWLRWRVLNAAAPYVVAIFANSPVYAGEEHRLRRARGRRCWRALDPARTGLPWDERAAGRGLSRLRARGAGDPAPDRRTASTCAFGEWLGRADVTLEEWHDHLTTLFPEVRPRGHFELRSADAVAPQWYAAPLALAVGITYESRALRAAADLLGAPDLGLLERAGRLGLRDPAHRATARRIWSQIALAGLRRPRPRATFHPADLEQARAFFDRYTPRGRAPGDDVSSAEVAA